MKKFVNCAMTFCICVGFVGSAGVAQTNPNGEITRARLGTPANGSFTASGAGMSGTTFSQVPHSLVDLHISEVVVDSAYAGATAGFSASVEGSTTLDVSGVLDGLVFLRNGVSVDLNQTFFTDLAAPPIGSFVLDSVGLTFPSTVGAGIRPGFAASAVPENVNGITQQYVTVKAGVFWENNSEDSKSVLVQVRFSGAPAWRTQHTVTAQAKHSGYDLVEFDFYRRLTLDISTLQLRTLVLCPNDDGLPTTIEGVPVDFE